MPSGEILWVCCACWNASVMAGRAARKAELAALPRCACCQRRATVTVYGSDAEVGLCGQHFSRAQAAHDRRSAGAFLFGPVLYSRQTLLEMARTGL